MAGVGLLDHVGGEDADVIHATPLEARDVRRLHVGSEVDARGEPEPHALDRERLGGEDAAPVGLAARFGGRQEAKVVGEGAVHGG